MKKTLAFVEEKWYSSRAVFTGITNARRLHGWDGSTGRLLLNMERYRSGHNGADSKSQNFGRADDINCIRRGIEVVITGLTRNARWLWPFSPLKTLDL